MNATVSILSMPNVGKSRFNDFISRELAGLTVPENGITYTPTSTFVCGRWGAGKSTFIDNFLGHEKFFPSQYHVDSDAIMKRLKEEGITNNPSDTSEFRAVQTQMSNWFGALNVSFTYSFAGKSTLSPVQMPLPKNHPAKTDDNRYYRKEVGHMILCDQDTAIERVKKRQAAGGHPYKPLEGDLETLYRRKQAEIIYGLPMYMEGTKNYFIWDSSKDREISLVAEVQNNDQEVAITLHDSVGAEKFGITVEDLGLVAKLYEHSPVEGYAPLFAKVCRPSELADDQKAILYANPDCLNHVFVRSVVDECSIRIAESVDLEVTCATANKVVFDPTEPYQ